MTTEVTTQETTILKKAAIGMKLSAGEQKIIWQLLDRSQEKKPELLSEGRKA